jgi:hypothetical protein
VDQPPHEFQMANATRLADCWNAHDGLVAALQGLLESGESCFEDLKLWGSISNAHGSAYRRFKDQSRSALAKGGSK